MAGMQYMGMHSYAVVAEAGAGSASVLLLLSRVLHGMLMGTCRGVTEVRSVSLAWLSDCVAHVTYGM